MNNDVPAKYLPARFARFVEIDCGIVNSVNSQ